MKYLCPKCRTIVLESGAMDKNGKHLGVDRQLRFANTEHGTFLTCPGKDCSEEYQVIFGEKEKVGWFRVMGLLKIE